VFNFFFPFSYSGRICSVVPVFPIWCRSHFSFPRILLSVFALTKEKLKSSIGQLVEWNIVSYHLKLCF
jgi:hypothetical protein